MLIRSGFDSNENISVKLSSVDYPSAQTKYCEHKMQDVPL